jgi:hypothetical protein
MVSLVTLITFGLNITSLPLFAVRNRTSLSQLAVVKCLQLPRISRGVFSTLQNDNRDTDQQLLAGSLKQVLSLVT